MSLLNIFRLHKDVNPPAALLGREGFLLSKSLTHVCGSLLTKKLNCVRRCHHQHDSQLTAKQAAAAAAALYIKQQQHIQIQRRF